MSIKDYQKIKIDCTKLTIGELYTRERLAELWGYNGTMGLEKGIIHPAGSNVVLLFTTYKKGKDAVQYEDFLNGNILIIDGQNAHRTDADVMNENNVIYSFYREKERTEFIYKGRARLIKAVPDKNSKNIKDGVPRKFTLQLIDSSSLCEQDAENEILNTLQENNIYSDGTQRYVRHVMYERNPANRRKAIEYHGSVCKICGFDFNKVYGKDFAEDYIEVHHIKMLAESGVCEINPQKDLIPVCANCHRMLHHKRNMCITPELLRNMIYKLRHNI